MGLGWALDGLGRVRDVAGVGWVGLSGILWGEVGLGGVRKARQARKQNGPAKRKGWEGKGQTRRGHVLPSWSHGQSRGESKDGQWHRWKEHIQTLQAMPS